MRPPNRDTTWQQVVVTVGLGGKGKPLRGKVVLGATFRMESGGSLMGGYGALWLFYGTTRRQFWGPVSQ